MVFYKIQLLLLLGFIAIPKLVEAESTFSLDKLIIEKAAKVILGKNARYNLILNSGEIAGVVPSKNGKFTITIGQKSYDEYGPDEGSLALVCHELGHVALGGKGFVSSEEEADYWATKECMPKLLKYFPVKKSEVATPFDSEFILACKKFTSLIDQDICLRSLKGSYFFRENTHKGLCNTQNLHFKSDEKELSKTPYKGKRPPNMSQCSFNNLVAGALKLKQPTCYNLMMMGFGFFGPNCSPGTYTGLSQEVGVVEDDEEQSDISIVNNSRKSEMKPIDFNDSKDSSDSQMKNKAIPK